MDRFFNEDSENEKPFFGNYNDDDDDDDMEEQTIAFIQNPELIQMMQSGLSQDEFKIEMLDKAIKIAESSWFWRFKSLPKKMKEITVIYELLMMIIEDPPEDTEIPPEENTI